MVRTLTAALISFGLALSLPLGAASKPAAKKTTKKTATTKAKTKAKTVQAPTRAGQQHPSLARYSEIQRALVDRGYLTQASGSWDADSVAALKRFQKEQGFSADGKLGALSLTALGLGPRRSGSDSISAGILPSGASPTPLD